MTLKFIRNTPKLTEQQPGRLTGKATTGAEASAQLGNVCSALEGRQLPQQHTLYQIVTRTERCAIKSLPCLQHKRHRTTKTLNLHDDVRTDRPATHLEAPTRGHATFTDRMHVDEMRRSTADSKLLLLI